MSAIVRAIRALRYPQSFWRETLRNGLLDRGSKPHRWFEYRAAVSRIHAARRKVAGGLESVAPADFFFGIDMAETTIVLRAATPYNISLEELVIISAATRLQKPETVFEFGTFDGRTTLHLAMNAPADARVFTLDVQTGEFRFGTDGAYFRTVQIGECFRDGAYGDRIVMLTGDSTKMDLAPYRRSMDLVFVDADHSYESALNDSCRAFEMVRPGGLILWHDYLMLEGVTKALVELKSRGVVHIAGTTLAAMRA